MGFPFYCRSLEIEKHQHNAAKYGYDGMRKQYRVSLGKLSSVDEQDCFQTGNKALRDSIFAAGFVREK